jgi:hypothetical protein
MKFFHLLLARFSPALCRTSRKYFYIFRKYNVCTRGQIAVLNYWHMYCVSVARVDSKEQGNGRAVNGIRTRRVMSKKLRGHETALVYTCELQSVENLRPLACLLHRAQFTRLSCGGRQPSTCPCFTLQCISLRSRVSFYEGVTFSNIWL